MIKFFLIVLAVLILLSMAGYAGMLWLKLRQQKALEKQLQEEVEAAQQARVAKIVDSIDVIARAMMVGQCDHSEGVLRLKPLLDVLGIKLANYPAMWALYEVVEEMPIMQARRELKKNERMRLDLVREAKEAELEAQIQTECGQLLNDIEPFKKAN